jgi:hypothetical protein
MGKEPADSGATELVSQLACRFQDSARRPASLTESFRGFSQSLQQMLGQYRKLCHDHFITYPSQFIVQQASY